MLGTPISRTEFVVAHLEGKTREHEVLFQRILAVKDTQACWLLLLCAPQPGRTSGFEWWFCRTSRWVGLAMFERCSGNSVCVSKGHCQLAIVHGRSRSDQCSANPRLLSHVPMLPPTREFWAGGGVALEVAAAQVCREAGARVSTIWMVDAWKSLRMGSRCGEEHNLRSTQHWFLHCTRMALQEEEQRTEMGKLLTKCVERKSEPARSCLVTEVERDWWCYLPRWRDDGRTKWRSS